MDFLLEDQDVMDYVQGNIHEPPSNAAAYIFEMRTSEEMYDKLVSVFRGSNSNQILFFKNQLKNIKKGKDESIQSYFMRLTKIKNNIIAIGE